MLITKMIFTLGIVTTLLGAGSNAHAAQLKHMTTCIVGTSNVFPDIETLKFYGTKNEFEVRMTKAFKGEATLIANTSNLYSFAAVDDLNSIQLDIRHICGNRYLAYGTFGDSDGNGLKTVAYVLRCGNAIYDGNRFPPSGSCE